jgi:hypothetical protein
MASHARWTAAVLLALTCCNKSDSDQEVADQATSVAPMVVAVAPILNFSGEFNLDPVKAADLLASELTYIDGITVLPVSRVVAVLAAQGRQQIESPAHALAVAEAVGADAIIVAGITEYDPYTPVVGVAVQMYRQRRGMTPGFDPVLAAREARPVLVAEMGQALGPTSQVQQIYNAQHDSVVRAVKDYAGHRSEGEQAIGWSQYVKVQTLFLRFCWHDAIERLIAQSGSWPSV